MTVVKKKCNDFIKCNTLQEEQEYVLTYQWRGFGSDCESEFERDRHKMADERRVPGAGDDVTQKDTDQTVPENNDQIDGKRLHNK